MPYVKKIQLVAQTFTDGPRHERIPKDVEPARSVFATIVSIGQKEFYQASAEGFTPEGKATVWQFEYKGERILIIDGQRYAIYRTYQVPGTNKMELYYTMQLGPSTSPEV